jgi:hypothetical protein
MKLQLKALRSVVIRNFLIRNFVIRNFVLVPVPLGRNFVAFCTIDEKLCVVKKVMTADSN